MKKAVTIRRLTQVFFFALIALISLGHTLSEKGIVIPLLSNASLHAVCPFGGVVSIYQYFVSGTYVKKIHESSFILMWIVFLLAIGFGPVLCGWICPLGTIQEWFSKIGRKVFKNRHNKLIPVKLDHYLRYTRYLILAWVVYMTAMTGKLTFAEVDPYSALFNLWSDEVAIGGVIILATTLIASILIERPWCKYACPYGALLGLSNLFRIFKIRRNSNTCIDCKKCSKACPMNIEVAEKNVVSDHQCISCLKCTSEEACPVQNTVMHRIPSEGFKLHVKAGVLGMVLLIVLFGGIGVTSALNMWSTTSAKVPVKIQTGNFKGAYNPADIRGSYTFQDISNSFSVPVDILGEAFGISDNGNLAAFQVKSLEAVYQELNNQGKEIGTASVRLFVGLYAGLPIELDGTLLPKSAVDILLRQGGLTGEQQEYVKTHSVDISRLDAEVNAAIESAGTVGSEKSAESTEGTLKPEAGLINQESTASEAADKTGAAETAATNTEHIEEEKTVKGKTTFSEVMSWGVAKDQIEEVIGGGIPAPGMTVSDYCRQKGIPFSSIKDTLNSLIDR